MPSNINELMSHMNDLWTGLSRNNDWIIPSHLRYLLNDSDYVSKLKEHCCPQRTIPLNSNGISSYGRRR